MYNIHIYIYIFLYIYTYIHLYMYIYVCVYVYMYIHQTNHSLFRVCVCVYCYVCYQSNHSLSHVCVCVCGLCVSVCLSAYIYTKILTQPITAALTQRPLAPFPPTLDSVQRAAVLRKNQPACAKSQFYIGTIRLPCLCLCSHRTNFVDEHLAGVCACVCFLGGGEGGGR